MVNSLLNVKPNVPLV